MQECPYCTAINEPGAAWCAQCERALLLAPPAPQSDLLSIPGTVVRTEENTDLGGEWRHVQEAVLEEETMRVTPASRYPEINELDEALARVVEESPSVSTNESAPDWALSDEEATVAEDSSFLFASSDSGAMRLKHPSLLSGAAAQPDSLFQSLSNKPSPVMVIDNQTPQLMEQLTSSEVRYNIEYSTDVHPRRSSRKEPLIGATISHFHILNKIGAGSFGAVYEAEDLRNAGSVAMKFLNVGDHDDVVVERFFREARALGKLKHPNIVRFLDFGRTEDDTLFLVMELLRGKSLRERFRDGNRMFYAQIFTVVKQVCFALGYIHLRSIFHRDLKPANIFLTTNEKGQTEAKLIDFGVASVEEESGALTGTGVCLGSPSYMSPEQARGDTRAVDGRSDLYSLGVILFQMLTGKKAFKAPNFAAVLGKHLFAPPPRLVDFAPKHSWVPELESFFQRVLAKSQDERPKDAAMFWEEFDFAFRRQAVADQVQLEDEVQSAQAGVYIGTVLGEERMDGADAADSGSFSGSVQYKPILPSNAILIDSDMEIELSEEDLLSETRAGPVVATVSSAPRRVDPTAIRLIDRGSPTSQNRSVTTERAPSLAQGYVSVPRATGTHRGVSTRQGPSVSALQNWQELQTRTNQPKRHWWFWLSIGFVLVTAVGGGLWWWLGL